MTPYELATRLMPDTRYAEGWDVHGYYQDNQLAGAALMRGSEFHWVSTDAFKLRRSEIREWLRPLFDRHGCLTTRLTHGDTANERFNHLFGFRRTWSDDRFHYFLMAELPFAQKEAACL